METLTLTVKRATGVAHNTPSNRARVQWHAAGLLTKLDSLGRLVAERHEYRNAADVMVPAVKICGSMEIDLAEARTALTAAGYRCRSICIDTITGRYQFAATWAENDGG